MNIINGETPLGYNINSKYDDELEKYGKRALVMAENFLPSMTLGRYMQRGVNIALGEAGLVEPKKNYYDEDMTVPELLGRSVGVRKFNEQKELNSKLRDANNLKKHQDKDPKSNKSANQKEYDAKVKRIKKVANKEGFDLSGVESDGFGFGKSDFGFKLE
jgi:hypothetical protein